MALDITSSAPIISSQGREICNYTGTLTGTIVEAFTPAVDTNAGTFQNLSECWLKVKLALDNAKDGNFIDNYCFILAPGQVKNVHFHGEYISDSNASEVAIVEEPAGLSKVDCTDYLSASTVTPLVDDSDIVAFVDITLFRA